MKERLITLAEKLARTDLLDKVEHTIWNFDDFLKAWRKFWKKHRQLERDIKIWGEDYVIFGKPVLFKKGESVSNPLQIVAIIALIYDANVLEDMIFEDKNDLVSPIAHIDTDFAESIWYTIREQYIIDVDCFWID